jgi:hypothetical protein
LIDGSIEVNNAMAPSDAAVHRIFFVFIASLLPEGFSPVQLRCPEFACSYLWTVSLGYGASQ